MSFYFPVLSFLIIFLTLGGCSTTQDVTLGKLSVAKPIASVAQVMEEDNPKDMNVKLQSALQKQGLTVKPPLPIGTRSSNDVDALVSYTDNWRWDIVMYLQALTLKVYDAKSGDLLAISEWHDSKMHAYRDSAEIMQNLVAETFNKINNSVKSNASQQ